MVAEVTLLTPYVLPGTTAQCWHVGGPRCLKVRLHAVPKVAHRPAADVHHHPCGGHLSHSMMQCEDSTGFIGQPLP